MNRDRGLTIVELMVVVLLVGILLLIALPAFQTSRACASKASLGQIMVGVVMRANMAYHSEHNQFMNTLQQVREEAKKLGDLPDNYWQGDNWNISMQNQNETIFIYATAKRKGLYSYSGSLIYDPNIKAAEHYKKYVKMICRSKSHSMVQAAAPALVKDQGFIVGESNLQMRCASETDDC
jgi:prepilin-type N-terminal cleavage/methylation domain-containing protein